MQSNAARLARLLGLLVVTVLVSTASADAYQVRLAWRPVSGAAGYRLYARQNGYPDFIAVDIGLPTADAAGVLHYAHGGLLVESTHTFALATYDAARVESTRSNELTVGYASAARIVDSDGDGLTDAAEDPNLNQTRDSGETDRLRSDTDGDGTSDGLEVAAGTDPLNAASKPGPTPTRTATAIHTTTPTRTATAVRTATRTPTPIPTRTPTRTATPVPTRTGTPVPSRTATPAPTRTSTPVPTRTATVVPTATRTATVVPTATRTATAVPTATRTATVVPSVTRTATPPATPSTTRTATAPPPEPTATPMPTGDLEAPLILSVERVD